LVSIERGALDPPAVIDRRYRRERSAGGHACIAMRSITGRDTRRYNREEGVATERGGYSATGDCRASVSDAVRFVVVARVLTRRVWARRSAGGDTRRYNREEDAARERRGYSDGGL
jgi:hypothetical protein